MDVDDLIRLAISEDVGCGDVTTDSVVSQTMLATGTIVVNEPGVICGLDIARRVCEHVDPTLLFSTLLTEGDVVKKKDVVATITGPARSILIAERLCLNFLTMMSGIATCTKKFVDKVRGKVSILDTRKTLPCLRNLQKYAVVVGGGVNHRHGLYDAVMIKDNHIAVAGGIANAVNSVRKNTDGFIEVECKTLSQVKEALVCGVERVMLDNMSLPRLKKAVGIIREYNSSAGTSCEIEVSGGVTLDTVSQISKCGVDYISIGSLTHSFSSLDLSMEVEYHDK